MNKYEKLFGIQQLMNARDHVLLRLPLDAYGSAAWRQTLKLFWELAAQLLTEPTN